MGRGGFEVGIVLSHRLKSGKRFLQAQSRRFSNGSEASFIIWTLIDLNCLIFDLSIGGRPAGRPDSIFQVSRQKPVTPSL